MHNLLDHRLFSRDMQLEFDNMCVTDSADTGKPKVSCNRADQKGNNLNVSTEIEMLYYIKKQPLELFYKKGVLKSFAKFTGKHLRRSLIFNKVAEACNFIKNENSILVFLWVLQIF